MAENTKISWAHHTFNPWRGCTKVSTGCRSCYAETLSQRNPSVLGVWGPQGTRVMASEAMWRMPLKWEKQAQESGKRLRVFCASLADVFEGPETCTPEAFKTVCTARARLFDLIAQTPNLDWLLLTKRPENIIMSLHRIARDTPRAGGSLAAAWINGSAPHNVWLGTSVENQEAADKRIPALLPIPAKLRFLSCEPLVGAVNLEECAPYILGGDTSNPGITNAFNNWSYHPLTCLSVPEAKGTPDGIGWVIVGGESGDTKVRPMHPDWVRSLRDQCKRAGVPFHFKQWGAWKPVERTPVIEARITMPAQNFDVWAWPDGINKDSWKTGPVSERVGKAKSGRLLDGEIHDAIPEVTL